MLVKLANDRCLGIEDDGQVHCAGWQPSLAKSGYQNQIIKLGGHGDAWRPILRIFLWSMFNLCLLYLQSMFNLCLIYVLGLPICTYTRDSACKFQVMWLCLRANPPLGVSSLPQTAKRPWFHTSHREVFT